LHKLFTKNPTHRTSKIFVVNFQPPGIYSYFSQMSKGEKKSTGKQAV